MSVAGSASHMDAFIGNCVIPASCAQDNCIQSSQCLNPLLGGCMILMPIGTHRITTADELMRETLVPEPSLFLEKEEKGSNS